MHKIKDIQGRNQHFFKLNITQIPKAKQNAANRKSTSVLQN